MAFGDPPFQQFHGNTLTTITTSATTYPVYLNTSPQIAPPKPKTNVDWLRARVDEICDEAYSGIAA